MTVLQFHILHFTRAGEHGADKGHFHFVDAVQHYKYLNLLMKAYLEVSLKILNEDVFIS